MNRKVQKTTIYELAQGFKLQWESKLQSHVLLYPEGLVKINDSAATILQQINGRDNLARIIQNLTEKFQDQSIENDIITFIEDAYEHKWIREAN